MASGHLRNEQTGLSKELRQLQGEMNAALVELLEVGASMDHSCRELDLGAELTAHRNDSQLTEARHTMQPQPMPSIGLTWTASLH